MGRTSSTPTFGTSHIESTPEQETIESPVKIQRILDVLDDQECREILDVTSDETLSANEVANMCQLPLSTTYRKLDMLHDTGMIEERTRIHRWGKHASEYSRSVDTISLSLEADGQTVMRITYREQHESMVISERSETA